MNDPLKKKTEGSSPCNWVQNSFVKLTQAGFSDAAFTKRPHKPDEAIFKITKPTREGGETVFWLQNPVKSTTQLKPERSLPTHVKSPSKGEGGGGGKLY